jgi:hypothetical protein
VRLSLSVPSSSQSRGPNIYRHSKVFVVVCNAILTGLSSSISSMDTIDGSTTACQRISQSHGLMTNRHPWCNQGILCSPMVIQSDLSPRPSRRSRQPSRTFALPLRQCSRPHLHCSSRPPSRRRLNDPKMFKEQRLRSASAQQLFVE